MTQNRRNDKAKPISDHPDAFAWPPPDLVAGDFAAWLSAILATPGLLTKTVIRLRQVLEQICLASTPTGSPSQTNARRYRHRAWQTDPGLRLCKDVHESVSAALFELLEATLGLNVEQRRRLNFWLKHLSSATCPAHNLWLNPEVRERAMQTDGQSLMRGSRLLKQDLSKNSHRLRIGRQPEGAFRIGSTIAATPAETVAENRMMRLKHYASANSPSMRRPLLIVPPCINRYYVLDLRADNSFVRWCVDQGLELYLIDWKPAGFSNRDCRFEDYVLEGVEIAVRWLSDNHSSGDDYDVMGYCIGGTIAVCHTAWRAARTEKQPHNLTLLTTLLDFAEPGELGVFISEDQLDRLEEHIDKHGVLSGELLRASFELLQPDELMWSMALRRYGMGLDNKPQDLLFWSDDNPALPGPMILDYLRQFYLSNRLVTPGGVKIGGIALDLSQIEARAMAVSATADHIAPWPSVYASFAKLPGKDRFVLTEGGHIGGMIHPPSKAAGSYAMASPEGGPQTWRTRSSTFEGSWWPAWFEWNAGR